MEWLSARSAAPVAFGRLLDGDVGAPEPGRILDVHLAAGDLAEVVGMERELSVLARANGIDGVQITGRRGWLKAFDGYQDSGTLLAKAL